ncbi:hypothetical protein EPA93_21490 [Ktedonosporobacter rubrisoli]|uniref:VOC domain-containing protein n=1 Tax=Ktedonosporobacter rubrisoli TaxID=2509675 RepID=A0A4P6JSC1_KTERU|nr:VOC family protein [Ktedonosporobacter rubrisoli]QBD78428.1 hypothetical protein EPA93_21490 [Ktedonosporobacter rubrisoli]
MKLITQLTVISVLVRDQEEALHFYTEKLGLERRVDVTFGPGLRLLTVAPPGQSRPEIALAKPDIALYGEERVKELIGNVSLRTACMFSTDNCRRMYELLVARGVKFVQPPTQQLYGLEAVFEDLYGNKFSLLEASPEIRSLFEKHYVVAAA